jgi:hypothetical protein
MAGLIPDSKLSRSALCKKSDERQQTQQLIPGIEADINAA